MNPITEKILNSRKYKDIYPKTIERIVNDCIKRYGEKRAEKEAKELIHQVWGAFYRSRPDFQKLLEKFSADVPEDDYDFANLKQIDDLLRIHSSTVERMKFIDEFYSKIFKITGKPKSIQDIGCGFTPLGIKHMGISKKTMYTASDIDLEEIRFLAKISKILFPDYNVKFEAADVLVDDFEYADVVFLLKTIPILERQEKNASENILDKLKYKYLVVSFPLKSLSGREVGMSKFYSENFDEILQKKSLVYKKLEFTNELVYVISSV